MAASNRLARLREAQGLSRDELGSILGVGLNVSDRTVRRWEDGSTSIPNKYWERLGEIFGVSIAYLLGLDAPTAVTTGSGTPHD